jgi:tRNA-2-methylthio-N6-dimethylallyladenosine synthase
MPKRLYIETVGCQMNVLDSELVVAALRKSGYELTNSMYDADTVLFNTCSVRQHPEDKIYSALGRLRLVKQANPNKIIGVLGCMAQKDQQLIFDRAPFVDLIVGPGQLHQVPRLLEEVAAGGGRKLEVSLDRKAGAREDIERSFESYDPDRDPTMRPSPYQAYVRIQIGCDKFCTYCIVPKVRGPEQGRNPDHIVAEARKLAEEGCLEITLLGQTVNSYRHEDGNRTTRLSDLLYRLHEIEGLKRLKFVTNFPKDMTDDLLQAVRDLPKCSPYLHVPAQSGSNAVLKRMKRGYTIEEYREMLARIRSTIPDAAVTSDFIVGFCGETEDDFQQTMDLVRESRFKNSFIFKYSERPGTKAPSMFADDIPEDVKRRRNNELLAVQNAICEEDNNGFLGRTVEVLIEGPSKRAQKAEASEAAKGDAANGEATPQDLLSLPGRGQGEGHHVHDIVLNHSNFAAPEPSHIHADTFLTQLVGRTPCDRIVVFDGNPRQIGQILPIAIYDCTPMTLFGAVVTREVGPEVYSLV